MAGRPDALLLPDRCRQELDRFLCIVLAKEAAVKNSTAKPARTASAAQVYGRKVEELGNACGSGRPASLIRRAVLGGRNRPQDDNRGTLQRDELTIANMVRG